MIMQKLYKMIGLPNFWDNKSGTVFFPCRFYPEELHKRGVRIRRV